ncbi:hypothetical protein CR513_07008, partial [Mucuna pruriens]
MQQGMNMLIGNSNSYSMETELIGDAHQAMCTNFLLNKETADDCSIILYIARYYVECQALWIKSLLHEMIIEVKIPMQILPLHMLVDKKRKLKENRSH